MLELLDLLGNLVILFVALVLMYKASDVTIHHSVKVAEVTGLGKTTVGFVLIALSTSLPELFVVVFSVFEPANIGVSIGNILGSNVTNICLTLGVCFFLIALKYPELEHFIPSMAKKEMGNLYFGLFIASIIPLSLLFVGSASFLIGIILLGVFFYNMYQLSKIKNVKEEPGLVEKQNLRKYVVLTIVGALGVVVSSYFIVEASSYIARGIGIPTVIIGATIVALGTSLPELVTGIDSVRKGHAELVLGNVIGSCFMNITLILGLALIFAPFRVEMGAFSDLIVLSLITNLILWYFLSNEKVGKQEGTVLLFLYSVFLVTSFLA
ncbi:MAG: sodium:calcium antiporter [Candidatus Bathyarchaeota archaeon]|nr:sodium:calcium antiporter [Candidatus Bathyarchaeum tardum]WGM90135.1 MAG: sodium:calcium antiporter [Candidatus Bathyarchaeum tardum]WNZ29731.1 MAG: sodium:calcium antiporter [Candidatus Bathyarchaeota archaeon]